MAERQRSDREQIAHTDRRWLLVVVAIFAVSAGGLFAAREVYHATGPHPKVTLLVRRVKRYANSLLRQGVRRP